MSQFFWIHTKSAQKKHGQNDRGENLELDCSDHRFNETSVKRPSGYVRPVLEDEFQSVGGGRY